MTKMSLNTSRMWSRQPNERRAKEEAERLENTKKRSGDKAAVALIGKVFIMVREEKSS